LRTARAGFRHAPAVAAEAHNVLFLLHARSRSLALSGLEGAASAVYPSRISSPRNPEGFHQSCRAGTAVRVQSHSLVNTVEFLLRVDTFVSTCVMYDKPPYLIRHLPIPFPAFAQTCEDVAKGTSDRYSLQLLS